MDDPGTQRIRVHDRRRRGWFPIDNVIIDAFGPELGPAGLAAYLAIVRHAHNNDDATVLFLRTLGEKTGISMTTLRETIRKLERLDLVQVFELVESTGQKANEYVVLEVPKAPRSDWQTRPQPERIRVDRRPPTAGDGPAGAGPTAPGGGVESALPPSAPGGGPTAPGGGPTRGGGSPSPAGGFNKELKTIPKDPSLKRVDSHLSVDEITALLARIERAAAIYGTTSARRLVELEAVTADELAEVRRDGIGRAGLRRLQVS